MFEIRSPEDLYGREAYVDKVDPKATKLIAVLADYRFKDKILCALIGCRTPHNFGYLIRTEDGRESNVGNHCGRKHFGNDFVVQRALHKRKLDRFNEIQTILSLQSNRASYLDRLQDLRNRPFGVAWAIKSQRDFRNTVTHTVFQQLSARARRGDVSVFEVRERDGREVARLHQMNPNSKREDWRYEQIPVGTLSGLVGLNFDFHETFVRGLELKLRALIDVDAEQLSDKERRASAKWVGTIERNFSDIDSALGDLLRFFRKENFQLLPHLTQDRQLKQTLATLAWDVQSGKSATRWPAA